MNLAKQLLCVAALALLQSTSAFASYASAKHQSETAQESLQETQRYAQKTGKQAPQPVDYTYDMKLDIAKVIYITPSVYHCGNISKYMSYEDSQGSLKTVRYLAQGKCRNGK